MLIQVKSGHYVSVRSVRQAISTIREQTLKATAERKSRMMNNRHVPKRLLAQARP